jgi:hypothetical protein
VLTSAHRRQQGYYRNYARENFVTWDDEEDEQKIAALMQKGKDDAAYIVRKVRKLTLQWSCTIVQQVQDRRCAARAASKGRLTSDVLLQNVNNPKSTSTQVPVDATKKGNGAP